MLYPNCISSKYIKSSTLFSPQNEIGGLPVLNVICVLSMVISLIIGVINLSSIKIHFLFISLTKGG